MSGYCNDCGNVQCLCKEIEQQEKSASGCTVEGLVGSFEVLRHAPSYSDYQWEVIGRGFETWRDASEWAHKFIDSRQIERSKIKVVAIINC